MSSFEPIKEGDNILTPMHHILNQKNILSVIVKQDDSKIYIGFRRDNLSDTNQVILESITHFYSETLFYTDDESDFNVDRLEYWCPDLEYAKRTNIDKRCHDKRIIVLELDREDLIMVLGASIMLANVLQEQDPLLLDINRDLNVYDADIIARHDHYEAAKCPDLRWISLTITLNEDNPLRDNIYAPLFGKVEINTPVSADNYLASGLVGYNEKLKLSFKLDREDLEKTICDYFSISSSHSLTDEVKKLLKN